MPFQPIKPYVFESYQEPEVPKQDVQTQDESGNQVVAGFKSGIDGLQATAYGAAALFGDAIDSKSLFDFGLEGYKRNIKESQNDGLRVSDYGDVHGTGDAFDYTMGAIGQAIPSALMMLGTGGIGGLVAKKGIEMAAKKAIEKRIKAGITKKADAAALFERVMKSKATLNTIRKGQFIGAAAGSMGSETGSVYGDVAEKGHTGTGAIAGSLATGIVAGGLDILPFLGVAKKFGFGGELSSEAAKKIASYTAKKRIGLATLETAGKEGVTESIQTGIEEVGKAGITGDALPSDLGHQMINAGVLGAIGGGALGGVSAIPSPHTPQAQQQDTQSDPQATQDQQTQQNGNSLSDFANDINNFDTPAPKPSPQTVGRDMATDEEDHAALDTVDAAMAKGESKRTATVDSNSRVPINLPQGDLGYVEQQPQGIIDGQIMSQAEADKQAIAQFEAAQAEHAPPADQPYIDGTTSHENVQVLEEASNKEAQNAIIIRKQSAEKGANKQVISSNAAGTVEVNKPSAEHIYNNLGGYGITKQNKLLTSPTKADAADLISGNDAYQVVTHPTDPNQYAVQLKNSAKKNVKAETKINKAPSDNFIQRIKDNGGLSMSLLRDTIGASKANESSAVGLFRKKGKSPDHHIEDMAKDFGIDTNTHDGGVQQFKDMVKSHLDGNKVQSVESIADSAEQHQKDLEMKDKADNALAIENLGGVSYIEQQAAESNIALDDALKHQESGNYVFLDNTIVPTRPITIEQWKAEDKAYENIDNETQNIATIDGRDGKTNGRQAGKDNNSKGRNNLQGQEVGTELYSKGNTNTGQSVEATKQSLIKTFGTHMKRAIEKGRVIIHNTDANAPEGVKRSFIGKKAETWDKEAAAQAVSMEKEGKDRDAIWDATGTFKGVDGKWRQELNSSSSSLKKPYPHKGQLWGDIYRNMLSKGKFTTVSDLLDFPSLFKTYPELESISMTTKKGKGGSYHKVSGLEPRRIDIGEDERMADVASIVLHELQHAIQDIEGFAKGGNPKMFEKTHEDLAKETWAGIILASVDDKNSLDSVLKEVKDDVLYRHHEDTTYSSVDFKVVLELHTSKNPRKLLEKWQADGKIHIDPYKSYKSYRRLAGEVEARNVQSRAHLNDKARRFLRPWESQDTPDKMQTIYMGKSFSQQAKFSKDGKIQGWYDPDGTVHIVAENNDESTLAGVMLHEAKHSFDESAKGKEILAKSIKQVQSADELAENGKGKVAAWMQDAKDAIPSDTPAKDYYHELFAYAVQQYQTNIDAMPKTIKNIVKRYLDALAGFVRAHLLKAGFNMKITPATLASLAHGEVRQLGKREGVARGENAYASIAKAYGITVEEAKRQYDAVVAKYKGTAQWMKAPNGKDTNLNDRQWVQVRTPAFKAWFGEFELDAKIVEAAQAFISSSLAGKTERPIKLWEVDSHTAKQISDLTGEDVTGFSFELNSNDLRHAIKGHGDAAVEGKRNQYPITKNDLLAIPYILKSPDYIKKGTSKGKRPSVAFGKKVNGTIEFVEVVLNNGVLSNKTMWKKKGEQRHQVTFDPARGSTPSMYRSIEDFLEKSKPSKVVDENGEPMVVYHGTKHAFNTFNSDKTMDGVFWFASDLERLKGGDVGAAESGDIIQAFISSDKIAGWDEYDKYSIDELDNLGYSSIELDGDFVVFNPNQIKSATGNTGQFNASNNDIRYSRAATREYTSDVQKVKDKLHNPAAKATVADAIKQQYAVFKDTWYQGTIDQFSAINKNLNDKRSWMMAHLTKSAPNIIEGIIKHGAPEMHQNAVRMLEGSKSLNKIFSPLLEETNDFLQWIAVNRMKNINDNADAAGRKAEVLTDRNKSLRSDINTLERDIVESDNATDRGQLREVLSANKKELTKNTIEIKHLKETLSRRDRTLTDKEINIMLTTNQGRMENGKDRAKVYEAVRKDFEALHAAIVKMAVDNHLVSKEEAAKWIEEGFYVPFYRALEDVGGVLRGASVTDKMVGQTAYKIRKGSDKPLNDLLSNVLGNWNHLVSASLNNQAALSALKTASKMGAAKQVKESSKSKDAVFVRANGKKVWFEVSDPLVLESLTALDFNGLNNGFMKTMRWFKRALTIGVTASPEFKIRNMFRDTIQALAVAKMSKNPFGNVAQGWKATNVNSKSYKAMLFGGGAFGQSGYIHGTDPDAVKQLVKLNKAGGLITDPENFAQHLWETYQDFGARLENVNRAANFEQALSDGRDLLTANFESRDHLDFSRTGSWVAVRAITQIIPFLNARMQGLDKVARAGMDKNQQAQFIAVVGTYSALSVMLYALMAGDDDYKDAEDWEKDTYHLIKLSRLGLPAIHDAKGNEIMFKIPRPFEVGAIANLFERIAQQGMDDKATGADFGNALWFTATQTLGIDPRPQIFKPAMEVYANKNSFTGRAIESMGMKFMPTTDRSKPWTSDSAIAASKTMGAVLPDAITLSPVQIQHLVRGYFGYIGTVGLGAMDMIVTRNLNGAAERPDWRMSEYPVVKAFVDQTPLRHTKYATDVYDALQEVNQTFNTIQRYRKGKNFKAATELENKNKVKLLNRHMLNTETRRVSQLNKKAALIFKDSVLTGAQKTRKLDDINRMKNIIFKRAAERIQK